MKDEKRETIRYSIDLDKEVHKKIKIYSIKTEKLMRDVVHEVLSEFVKKIEKDDYKERKNSE